MSSNVHPIEPVHQENADTATMQRVFESQRATSLRWRESTAEERLDRLFRLRDAVMAHKDELIEAGMRDSHKSETEVTFCEILPLMADISEYRHQLKKWMKPTHVRATRTTNGLAAHVKYEPRGRCLILAPWNYPVTLTFTPLVAALASGNTAMIKPSEVAPHASAWMVKVIREVFSEDEVAIFEGDASVSTALLELPFDHVFFTGAPSIGKIVMAAAAKHLASVTLELGGKSPTIVDETADLKLAAENLIWGKLINSGQTCIAPDHVYVHASVKDEFVQRMQEVIKERFGATPAEQQQSPDLTHMINERHTRRVGALLDDATKLGANVVCGGVVDTENHFIAPTLLDNIPAEAEILQEEIFGPVYPIISFTDLGEVIDKINDAPKPLALYVFSKNKANVNRVLMQTSSGGACVNHSIVHFGHGNLPFGGVNNSGIGSYHGIWGFKTFSHERAVVETRFMLARMFYPPYTDLKKRLIDWTVAWYQRW